MTATVPIKPPGVITQEFLTPRAIRRGIIAGVAGNILEWYDFALFGFFAQQIGAHFFPATNRTASLLAAFGTFAAGFLMRPDPSLRPLRARRLLHSPVFTVMHLLAPFAPQGLRRWHTARILIGRSPTL